MLELTAVKVQPKIEMTAGIIYQFTIYIQCICGYSYVHGCTFSIGGTVTFTLVCEFNEV